MDRIKDTLATLMDKIPGYTGFKDRKERRESDKHQREFMARRLTDLKSKMQAIQEDFLGAGNLSIMEPFDKIGNKLDRVAERIRHANQGLSGIQAGPLTTQTVEINEDELARIYEYDLTLVNMIAGAEEALVAIESAADGSVDPKMALKALNTCVTNFDNALTEREAMLKGIK